MKKQQIKPMKHKKKPADAGEKRRTEMTNHEWENKHEWFDVIDWGIAVVLWFHAAIVLCFIVVAVVCAIR